jgi:hypothetical protein
MGLVSPHALLDPWAASLPRDAAPVRLWHERFDYVLVLNADLPDASGPLPPVPGLEPVADEGFARLYRVHRRPGPAEPTAGRGRAPVAMAASQPVAETPPRHRPRR